MCPMSKAIFSLFLTAIICATTYSQAARPSPTPPAEDGDVVKITTALIQLDVTVTDRSGKVIPDIRPDELEVYENGVKQKLTNFSFVSNLRTREEPATNRSTTTRVALPPAPVRPEQVRRTIAIVVDDLTLSFESTHFVRNALKNFIEKQMQEGDLIAIIRTGAGIGSLQQFTNDKRQLYAAVEKVRYNPLGTGRIGAFAPVEAKIQGSEAPEAQPGERTEAGIQKEFEGFREAVFATGTLGAVNYVVRGMQDLPGRKSIMLLSDGFRLFQEDALGFRESGRVYQSLQRLIDLANRASVVIYTMDGRGLQPTGLTAQDSSAGYTFQELLGKSAERSAMLSDTQDGLKQLAKKTGGFAIINNNDLSGGIRKILDDQSYYLVAYEPDDETFDPRTRRFNNLEIKVTRPGALVRYRSGFFGVSDEKIVKPVQTTGQRLVTALTSPFAVNEINLRLNALFYNSTRSGNVVRSLIHIPAQDLKFTDEPDGTKKVEMDVVAAGFGGNGSVVDKLQKTYTLNMTKERYEQVMNRGFVYDFSFPVDKPGAYQLRIAIRDHGSDRIGSANQFVEVPNIRKGRLTLSGVVLENVPFGEWQRRSAGRPRDEKSSDPLIDTSTRRFKRGTVLNYGFTIYNPTIVGTGADLSYQTRVFRDGKVLFESASQPVVPTASAEPRTVGFTSALALGAAMEPGDYVLQVVVTDNAKRSKQNTATQLVTFEIVD
jgi:VWFA-related protein